MYSRELLTELLRHMEWADAKVWAAVPDGATDKRLTEWLVHIHTVQRAFLTMWTGGDLGQALRGVEEFPSLAEVRAWARPFYAEAHAFIAQLPPERVSTPLALPWAQQISQRLGRPIGPTTIGETCFQVMSHSTYHRGQVNARLRELGAEPPLVDYIAWLWFGRPAPEW